jgi:hypothetical protein
MRMAVAKQKHSRRHQTSDGGSARLDHPLSHYSRAPLSHLQRTAGNRALGQIFQATLRPTASLHRASEAAISKSADHDLGTGRPLDPVTRAFMESRFGHDFSGVRVYSDDRAAASAEELNAKAYTVGRSVVFNRRFYSPGSEEGDRLLAHELAHVIQQGRGGAGQQAESPALQQGADFAARGVMAGKNVSVAGACSPGIAREPKNSEPKATEEDLFWTFQDWRERNPVTFVEFLTKNENVLYRLLSPYGYTGCRTSDDAYLADFDGALAKWMQKNPMRQMRIRIPTPEEMEARDNEVILAALPDGTGYIGTRRGFRANVQSQKAARALRTVDNIRSGIFGTIGYALGGDEGSDLGANFDALAGAAAGIAGARQSVRQNTTPAPRPSSANIGRASTSVLPPKNVAAPLESEPLSTKPVTRSIPPKRDVGLADKGYRPQPGERSTTRQEWKSTQETERFVKRITPGTPLKLQEHGAASTNRKELKLSGQDVQSAHELPASVGKRLPGGGYNPKAALTTLQEKATHTGMDQYWKDAFQAMRRGGRTQATAQEVYDTVAESIRRAPNLAQGEKDSHILRLHDEMFIERGLKSGDLLDLPYPNIKPAK